MKLFEFGGGGSTIWFSQRVGEIISIEHDPEWHRYISGLIGGCYDVREQSPSGQKYRVLQKNNNPLPDYSVIAAPTKECRQWFSDQLQLIAPQEVFDAAKSLLT